MVDIHNVIPADVETRCERCAAIVVWDEDRFIHGSFIGLGCIKGTVAEVESVYFPTFGRPS